MLLQSRKNKNEFSQGNIFRSIITVSMNCSHAHKTLIANASASSSLSLAFCLWRALSTSISLVRVAPSNQPPVFPLYSNLPASIQSMAAAPLEGETSLTHHAPPAASGHSAAFYWKSERAVPLFDHQGDADVRAHSSLVQSPESLTVAKRSLMANPAARAISNVILSMALDIYYQKQIVETKEIYFHNTSIS